MEYHQPSAMTMHSLSPPCSFLFSLSFIRSCYHHPSPMIMLCSRACIHTKADNEADMNQYDITGSLYLLPEPTCDTMTEDTGWNASANLKLPITGSNTHTLSSTVLSLFMMCVCRFVVFSARWRQDLGPNIRDSGNQWGVLVCVCACMCIFMWDHHPWVSFTEVEPRLWALHTQRKKHPHSGCAGQWLGLSCFLASPTAQKEQGRIHQHSSLTSSASICYHLLMSHNRKEGNTVKEKKGAGGKENGEKQGKIQ